MKVLVVDDSALVRRLLGRVFQDQGFVVDFARDGAEAMACLHRFQPDVVTLDVHMPQMDGLACLDRIMVERPCPVVMISSLTGEGADATLKALDLGAIDFLLKPDGALSLSIDDLSTDLVAKVKAAAGARVRQAPRLAERVRAKVRPARNAAAAPAPQPPAQTAAHGVSRPDLDDVIVLVGTSTGGPPALDRLLGPLPAGFPWPILVAQHMPGTFTGPLAQRLDRLCALEVVEVVRPMPVQAGCVYIGKGDADLILSRRAGRLVAMAAPSSPDHRWHPSVDRLVDSALQHVAPQALVGVLMTGMGDDGAAAMTRLRALGGRTIAEAAETAVIWGMPGALVRADGADLVAPLHELAGILMDWTT